MATVPHSRLARQLPKDMDTIDGHRPGAGAALHTANDAREYNGMLLMTIIFPPSPQLAVKVPLKRRKPIRYTTHHHLKGTSEVRKMRWSVRSSQRIMMALSLQSISSSTSVGGEPKFDWPHITATSGVYCAQSGTAPRQKNS